MLTEKHQRMRRYYFHIEGPTAVTDLEGVEMPDAGDAVTVCRKHIVEVASEKSWRRKITPDHRMRVTNEAGETVFIVKFDRSVFKS